MLLSQITKVLPLTTQYLACLLPVTHKDERQPHAHQGYVYLICLFLLVSPSLTSVVFGSYDTCKQPTSTMNTRRHPRSHRCRQAHTIIASHTHTHTHTHTTEKRQSEAGNQGGRRRGVSPWEVKSEAQEEADTHRQTDSPGRHRDRHAVYLRKTNIPHSAFPEINNGNITLTFCTLSIEILFTIHQYSSMLAYVPVS